MSFGIMGINAFPVDVEADMSRGGPQFDIVGLPDTAVKESRERVKSAFRACDMKFPVASLMINLAPADMKKTGSVHDMAVFMAILRVCQLIDLSTDGCAFVGEISFNGDIREIKGVLPMVIKAKELGLESVFVPYGNSREASVIDGVNIYPVKSAEELIMHFRYQQMIKPCKRYIPSGFSYDGYPDFADVKGQQSAKKALEIAVAGGHNVLLVGTPGCGKSMLAKRVPSILPPLTFRESLETTKIHSVMGLVGEDEPIIVKRPFQSPHHTASAIGLVGGGSNPQPGQISLAHNGVLFLDEIAEFSRKTLEILRQPLEDGKITISRVNGICTYPCDFILIGAMNPCPCGYYGHPKKPCTCTRKKVIDYKNRISGPVAERFDLQVDVAPLDFGELTSEDSHEETSAEIRKRVISAREIQKERFRNTGIKCNALITTDKMDRFCHLDEESNRFIQMIFDRMRFSARIYDKLRLVARTVADLEGSENITIKHISTAFQYRSLDRNFEDKK